MASHATIEGRIRAALAGEPSSREVAMFGGVAFMLHDKMLVAVDRHGDLIVRIDPGRSRDLLTQPGARPGEMGAGRTMGPGWLGVATSALTDEALSFWIGVALEYNTRTPTR